MLYKIQDWVIIECKMLKFTNEVHYCIIPTLHEVHASGPDMVSDEWLKKVISEDNALIHRQYGNCLPTD